MCTGQRPTHSPSNGMSTFQCGVLKELLVMIGSHSVQGQREKRWWIWEMRMDNGNGSVRYPQGLYCVFYVKHWLGKIKRPSFNRARSFPSGSDGKESACNAGGLGSITGSRRFPGEGNGHPLQYSCLENSLDRGACWATVQRVAKGRTRLSD